MTPRRSGFLALGLVLALSLFLRLHRLNVFLSGDETKWICRAINFRAALVRGDLKSTYQSEHPGVLTMWLGALAVPLSRAGEWVDLCASTGGNELIDVSDHTKLAGLPPLIFQARRWIAVATWLGILGIWWFSRHLFGEQTALLSALFIGLDPFYLALSRVLHVDALLATLMALSVLSLLAYLRGNPPRLRYLLISAVAAGLAIANKSPGLFLVPGAGLLFLWCAWPSSGERVRLAPLRALRMLLLWGGLAVAVFVVTWPTLWIDPIGALGQVFGQALVYADTPHLYPSFFWGQVRPDPGPAFYPVAWAFRTTPWVILGLLLIPWPEHGRQGPRSRFWISPTIVLGGFALLYTAFMTLGAKKFDRYLLPVFPLLDLLAAVGWAKLLGRWSLMNDARWRSWSPLLSVLPLGLAQFMALWPARPYYFSYYNPLLGGTRAAQHVLLLGWGEGLERAAAYLNSKPGAEQFDVSTEHVSQFGPFFRGRSSLAKKLDVAYGDFYVLYISTIQRWRTPEVLERLYEGEEPDYVVSINGVDYVWVYGNNALREGLAYIDSYADRATDCILLDVPSSATRQYAGPLPLSVVDGKADEAAIIQALARVAEGRQRIWYLTFRNSRGDVEGLIHRHLERQADLVERVTFRDLAIERFDLHRDAEFAPPMPTVRRDVRLGDDIRLLGYDLPEHRVSTGQPLTFTLYWQSPTPVEKSYTCFTHLLGPDGQIWGQYDGLPLGGARPTTTWLPGEVIVDQYAILLEAGAPDGDYALAVGLYDLRTMERLPATDSQGRRLPYDRLLIEGLVKSAGGK